MLVISCHADTGFRFHQLTKLDRDVVEGHLDNFAGVYAVMQAYFSGKFQEDYAHIALTYGEEDDMAGAEEVLDTLRKHDVVIVVDVTGTKTKQDFVIEKCSDKKFFEALQEILKGMSFDIYEDCPDPIATEDEVDVYSEECPYTCMLAIPCWGGDYNEGVVKAKEASIQAVAQALVRIVENFPALCQKLGVVVS